MCLTSCWTGIPQESPTSLTASIFPLIASIRPAKNRKMAPCNDIREDPCGSTWSCWGGVPSNGWSHLGVSVQVRLQQLLCLLDVDIPSTWRWQGGTLLRFPLLGPVFPLATCQSLLGFPLWDGTSLPISRVIGGLNKLMWILPRHITGSIIIWKPFLSLHAPRRRDSIFILSTRWRNHPQFTDGAHAERKWLFSRPGAGPRTWLGPSAGRLSRVCNPSPGSPPSCTLGLLPSTKVRKV